MQDITDNYPAMGDLVAEYQYSDCGPPGPDWVPVAGIRCSFHYALAAKTGGRFSILYKRKPSE